MPVDTEHTYDLNTDIGKVRLLIGDHPKAGEESTYEFMYSDKEIQAFLDLSNGSVYLAAATTLDMIAADWSKTSRSVSILDISVSDGDYAGALRDRANALREQDAQTGESVIEAYFIPGAFKCGY